MTDPTEPTPAAPAAASSDASAASSDAAVGGDRLQASGNGRRPPRRRRRRSGAGRPRAVGLWQPVPALPPIEPVIPAKEPAALLRSLGDPPLPGQGAAAGHYLAAVIERAAQLAVALAASANLLAPDDESAT